MSNRCRTVQVGMPWDTTSIMRCTIQETDHKWDCHFSNASPQEICLRASVNHSSKKIRFCIRIEDHGGDHDYNPITERTATREELRLPTIECGHVIHYSPRILCVLPIKHDRSHQPIRGAAEFFRP